MTNARDKLAHEMAVLRARISPRVRARAEQAVKTHIAVTNTPPATENLAARIFQAAMEGDRARREDILAALEHRMKNSLH